MDDMVDQKRQDKLSGLFAVQFAGLFLAFWMLYFGAQFYTLPPFSTPSPYRFRISAWGVFWTAVAVTMLLFLLSRPGFQAGRALCNLILGLINAFRGSSPFPMLKPVTDRSWFLELGLVMRALALVDLFGFGVWIKQTGGVEGSVFVPVLLILPTIVILVDICSGPEILFWGTCSLLVFGFSIDPFEGYHCRDTKGHHVLLMVSTAFCTFFPFLFVKTSRKSRTCPHCLGTGILAKSQPEPDV